MPVELPLPLELALQASDYAADLNAKAQARLQAEIDGANRDAIAHQQLTAIETSTNDLTNQLNAIHDVVAENNNLLTRILGKQPITDSHLDANTWELYPTLLDIWERLNLNDVHAFAAELAAEGVQTYLRGVVQGIGRYSLDADGVAAYQSDVVAGLITGEGLFVLRRNTEGEQEPALNPLLLTFTDPSRDERFGLLDVVIDVLTSIPFRPSRSV